MSRAEFSKPTKRLALHRSGGQCEARGTMYGLGLAVRCFAPLGYGVEFDHILLAANGGGNSLENCAAVCIKCHKWKTANHDTPKAAKTLRQQDKALGIRKRPSFQKPPGWKHNWRTGRMEREVT
jgi:5-methylcytosine-specific restriction endonuclease McrA